MGFPEQSAFFSDASGVLATWPLTGSSCQCQHLCSLGRAAPTSPCAGQRQFGITGPRTARRPLDPSGTAQLIPVSLRTNTSLTARASHLQQHHARLGVSLGRPNRFNSPTREIPVELLWNEPENWSHLQPIPKNTAGTLPFFLR